MEQHIIEIIVTAILLLYPTWRIFTRAGLIPALSLFVLIPGIGILICALILIFSNWKIKSLEENN